MKRADRYPRVSKYMDAWLQVNWVSQFVVACLFAESPGKAAPAVFFLTSDLEKSRVTHPPTCICLPAYLCMCA